MINEPETTDKVKKDDSQFEKFRKNFWKHFQGWLFDDQPSITYDVDLDERVLRQIRDKYLHRDDYPSLNELKQIIIFKSNEDKVRWGTDLTAFADDFNNDLKRGIKKALELARFDLGQVKPKQYQEEQTVEAAPVPKEPSPQKKNLSVKDFAEEIERSTKTVKRYVKQGMIRANTNEDGRILGIPRSELDAFLKKTV